MHYITHLLSPAPQQKPPAEKTPEEVLNQATSTSGLKARYKNIYQVVGSPKLSLWDRYVLGKGSLSDSEAKKILSAYSFKKDEKGFAAKALYTSLRLAEAAGVNYQTKEGRAQIKLILGQDLDTFRSQPLLASSIKDLEKEYIARSIVRWVESQDGLMLREEEFAEIAEDFDIELEDVATLLGQSEIYTARICEHLTKIREELTELSSPRELQNTFKQKQASLEQKLIAIEATIAKKEEEANHLYETYHKLAAVDSTPFDRLGLLKTKHERIRRELTDPENGLYKQLENIEKQYQEATDQSEYCRALIQHRKANEEKLQELHSAFTRLSNPFIFSKNRAFRSDVIQKTNIFPTPISLDHLPHFRSPKDIYTSLLKGIESKSNILIINALEELDALEGATEDKTLLDELLLLSARKLPKEFTKGTDEETLLALMRSLLLDEKHLLARAHPHDSLLPHALKAIKATATEVLK